MLKQILEAQTSFIDDLLFNITLLNLKEIFSFRFTHDNHITNINGSLKL